VDTSDVGYTQTLDEACPDATDQDKLDHPATGARAVFDAAKEMEATLAAQQAFHDARQQWTEDNLTPPKDALTAMQTELDDLMDMKAAQGARLLAAKQACKVKGFEDAQEALAVAQAIQEKRDETIAEVQAEYALVATFPAVDAETGLAPAGALCNYGVPDENGIVADRPTCFSEEEDVVLCCGAAQRFLKDGTKLSIETCQPADRTTYTYYPALPVDAVVMPTPETWRFQCISAAQKLAAAATAALAAGYMMA